jgi:hypothetical protein
MTSLVFGNTFGITEAKRNVQLRVMTPSPSPSKKPSKKNQHDKRPQMERFIDELKQGGRYDKTRGWRRRRNYPPGQSKLPPRMSTMERKQLWVKINLLESHLLYCPHEYIPKKDMTTGKFLKQKVNPLTLDFLVQQAWGIGKMF